MIQKFPCGCTFDTDKCDPLSINWKCPNTWNTISKGLTYGVFQLESDLGKQWVQKLKPENMEHIAALGSILRPGCLKGLDDKGVSTTAHYCKRKNKEEAVEPYDESVDKILSTSYGCMIYQEQMMQVAQAVAGFDLQQADILRKGIGKKLPEVIAKCKKEFLDGVKRTKIITEEQGDYLFGLIEKSQRYAFNKCVSFDTVIKKASNVKSHNYTVEHMYRIRNDINYAKSCGQLDLYKKYKHQNHYGYGLSFDYDRRIRPNIIRDIQPAGIRPVYRVTLTDGSYIDTTLNHKFPTNKGTLTLDEIKNNLNEIKLLKCGQYEPTNFREKNRFSKRLVQLCMSHMKKVNQAFGPDNYAYTNGSFTEFNKADEILPMECQHCGAGPSARLEKHHKNGDRTNSAIANLERLCSSCHKKADYKLGRTRRGQKGYAGHYTSITSVAYIGDKQTYDVTMDGPNHTFVTDQNIVTCNSHAVAYGILGYICAWLKTHYPLDFYCGWLKRAKDKNSESLDEIACLVNEAKALGVEVLPPLAQDLKSNFYIKDGKIFFGMANIKGISEITAEKAIAKWKKISAKLTWYELLTQHSDKISGIVFTAMIRVGGLRGYEFGIDRAKMCTEYGHWNKLTDREKVYIRSQPFTNLYEAISSLLTWEKTIKSGDQTLQIDKKRIQIVKSLLSIIKNPPYDDKDNSTSIADQETILLGVPVSGFHLDDYDTSCGNCCCADVLRGEVNKGTLPVVIKDVRTHLVKKGKSAGEPMAFLKVIDHSGGFDGVVVFPDTYRKFKELFVIDNKVALFGYYNGSFIVQGASLLRYNHTEKVGK